MHGKHMDGIQSFVSRAYRVMPGIQKIAPPTKKLQEGWNKQKAQEKDRRRKISLGPRDCNTRKHLKVDFHHRYVPARSPARNGRIMLLSLTECGGMKEIIWPDMLWIH